MVPIWLPAVSITATSVGEVTESYWVGIIVIRARMPSARHVVSATSGPVRVRVVPIWVPVAVSNIVTRLVCKVVAES